MDSPVRRPRFAEEDDILASIAVDFNRLPFFSSTGHYTAASSVVPWRNTATNVIPRSSSSSPRSFIACPDEYYGEYRQVVSFAKGYIFPGGVLPSLSRVALAMANASRL